MSGLLKATLVSTKQVSLQGLKSKFKIFDACDMQMCGDQEYIRLHARNHSLMSLITENNPRVNESRQPKALGIAQLRWNCAAHEDAE